MGPRCHYATTVEVAYPLRPFRRRPEGLPDLSRRVVIPEPSLWEPESPLLYEGPIELWEEGRLCDQVHVIHGLRTLRLGRRGLLLNGRPLTLRGVAQDACSEEEATLLRRSGCNLLLAAVAAENAGLWAAADRLGFLVLGRLQKDEESLPLAKRLSEHASCLGWVLPGGSGEQTVAALRGDAQALIGIAWEDETARTLPAGVSFIVCPESVADVPLPRIVLTEAAEYSAPGVLGWIRRA